MYKFETPTVDEGPTGPTRLDLFYTIPKGVTVLKLNGVYTTERYPLSQDVINADAAYLGGHIYIVSDAEAQDLIDAGFEDYLTEIIDES